MNNKDRIEKIKSSFPLLKNHKIFVMSQTKFIWGARAIYFYFFSLYLIGRGAEKGLTKGGIAHELSHMEVFKEWGYWKSLWLGFLQYFSESTREKIERSADLRAIKRGYGKELYKTRSAKVPKKIRKFLDKYYLSLVEIKRETKKYRPK